MPCVDFYVYLSAYSFSESQSGFTHAGAGLGHANWLGRAHRVFKTPLVYQKSGSSYHMSWNLPVSDTQCLGGGVLGLSWGPEQDLAWLPLYQHAALGFLTGRLTTSRAQERSTSKTLSGISQSGNLEMSLEGSSAKSFTV